MKPRRSGWRWFIVWSIAGALAFYSALDLPGFGLLVAPIALACLWWVATRARVWPEIMGLGPGLGVVLGALAWANRGYEGPCPSSVILGSGGRMSCGGVPPVPILVAGVVLVLIGVMAYATLAESARPGGSSGAPAAA